MYAPMYTLEYGNETELVYWFNCTFEREISADVYYTDFEGDDKYEYVKLPEKLRSLCYAVPPALTSSSSNIEYGQKTVTVSLSSTFNFPETSYAVQKFEWILPDGWRESAPGGRSGTFITESSSINITTNDFGGGTVQVRGVNHATTIRDVSEPSILTFGRSIEYYRKPANISYGKAQNYTYTVTNLSGATYEWEVPSGWKINGGSNRLIALNASSITVTSGICPSNGVVRVRISKGGGGTSWHTVPYGGVVDPPIAMSAPYQFENAGLSIDIPQANLSSINWTVSGAGANLISGQSTNAPRIIFSSTGTANISATFTLVGCGTKTITKAINIQPTRFYITGNDVVCSVSTEVYRITNNIIVPSEVQLTWSAGDKLTFVSGQGTSALSVKAAVSKWGNESINLKIQYGGQSKTVTRSVHVSYPIVTSVSGPGNLQRNQTGSFTANPYFSSDVADYKWTISPLSGVSQSPYRHTNMISFSQEGSYTVSCQAYTARCGASGSAGMTYVSVYGGYAVYSSPGSKIVTIVISDLSLPSNMDKTMSDLLITTSDFATYILVDSMTGKVTAEGRFPRKGGTLDFSSQSNGIYVLTIMTPEKFSETHKLILR